MAATQYWIQFLMLRRSSKIMWERRIKGSWSLEYVSICRECVVGNCCQAISQSKVKKNNADSRTLNSDMLFFICRFPVLEVLISTHLFYNIHLGLAHPSSCISFILLKLYSLLICHSSCNLISYATQTVFFSRMPARLRFGFGLCLRFGLRRLFRVWSEVVLCLLSSIMSFTVSMMPEQNSFPSSPKCSLHSFLSLKPNCFSDMRARLLTFRVWTALTFCASLLCRHW